LSELSKKAQAQQREMPEPYEQNRPIPWLVIVIVAGVFLWAIGYIWLTHQTDAPGMGDRRVAADFVVAAGSASGAVDGAQIYTAQCLACHQASGAGLPGVFPPLAGSEWMSGKPSVAIQILLHGIDGALTVKGNTYNGHMPPFGDKLDDAEIAAVLSHVRSSFGNTGEPVDAEQVKAERAATQGRDKPWGGDAELAGLR